MRDVTPSERQLINRGVCPCCHQQGWLAGPRGGMAINIECSTCGLRANVFELPRGVEALQI